MSELRGRIGRKKKGKRQAAGPKVEVGLGSVKKARQVARSRRDAAIKRGGG